MSVETTIYFLALLFVGVPAALRVSVEPVRIRVRNPTALAMVATWIAGRAVYAATGEWLPLKAMVLFDWAVIVAILSKKDWRICSPHGGWQYLICFLWHERSPCDRAILALFPMVWLFYAPVVDSRTQYWVLWSLSMAQLALAGLEPLQSWLGAMAKTSRADAKGRPPPGLTFHAPVRETGLV